LVEVEKEKEQLTKEVTKLTQQNARLRHLIEKINEEKESALSANLALKASIPP
jgi:uncharacterized coiled-coil protein SlyX